MGRRSRQRLWSPMYTFTKGVLWTMSAWDINLPQTASLARSKKPAYAATTATASAGTSSRDGVRGGIVHHVVRGGLVFNFHCLHFLAGPWLPCRQVATPRLAV